MNKNIEVEGGEIAIRNSNGDLAIIPKNKVNWVKQKLSEGCHDCIDSLVETLPVASQYARDGSVYPDGTKVKVNQDNQIKEYDISSPEYKDLYNSGRLMSYDKTSDTYIAPPLEEVIITGKKQYDYQGCVSGLCNDLAEKYKMNVANFRQLNNLYGNAWEINKNNYGQDVDFTDFKNLKEGDIINLSRDAFKTDEEKGIYGPGHNSFVKAEDGKTDLCVYHARQYDEIIGDPLYDANRHTMLMKVAFDEKGFPVFRYQKNFI